MNTLNSDASFHTMLYGKLMFWSDGGSLQPVPEPYPDAKILVSYTIYKHYCDQNGLSYDIDHVANVLTADWKVALQDYLQDQMVRGPYLTC